MEALKRIATGLALAGLLLVVGVTAAQAVEYGRCKAQKGGKYTSSMCTTLSKEAKTAKYEWYPAPTGSPAFNGAFATSSGKVELSTEDGTVTCKHSTGTGEITELNLDTVKLTLTTCTLGKAKTQCASGGDPFYPESGEEVPGQIVTKTLRGRLVGHGATTGGSEAREPAEGEVWDEYVAQGEEEDGTPAEFHCGEIYLEIKGSITAAAEKPLKLSSSATDVFGFTEGEQSLTAYAFNGELFKEIGAAGLVSKVKLVATEKIGRRNGGEEPPCCPCTHPLPEQECRHRE